MQQESRFPDTRIPTLGGLNERVSPANLQAGQFDVLEGFYPAQVGLLQRIGGKRILANITGKVLSFGFTSNINSELIVSTTTGRYVYTLDELFDRAVTPNLTYQSLNDEETMSYALIVQKEANTVGGGSIRGYISGTDSGSATDTFYGRRLTDMLVNDSATVVSFTASTGGAGAVSTEGQFTLGVGTYRITAWATFRPSSNNVILGLYNVTSGAFEVYAGTSVPIISSPTFDGTGENTLAMIEAEITVTSTNKTYALRQEINGSNGPTTVANSLFFCGANFSGTAANVNGAAAANTYASIRILKVA